VQVFKASVATLDMLFPPACAALLSALYTWVMRSGGMPPLRLGQLAPWIAAALDWLENLLLLALLHPVRDAEQIAGATFPPALVGLMSGAAAMKLALLAVTVAITLVALFVGPRGKVLARCRFSALSVALGSAPLIALPQGRDLLLTLADDTASGFAARLLGRDGEAIARGDGGRSRGRRAVGTTPASASLGSVRSVGPEPRRSAMKGTLRLSWPTLVSVAATRGMMGVGAGILLASRIDRKRRRAVGLALFGLGLASTIPLAARVFGSRLKPLPPPGAKAWPERAEDSPLTA
jgi:hypothetical protein